MLGKLFIMRCSLRKNDWVLIVPYGIEIKHTLVELVK